MSVYQIIVTHNRNWTIRKIIVFAVVFLIAAFLAMVFGSTVFTRTPGIRQYQLEVFWSWKEILGIGKCGRLGSTAEGGLLQENLLDFFMDI